MNMGLAVALLAMTTLAVALLLIPLILRSRRAENRDAYNLAVYRDQLAEVERDLGRGIIAPEEAEAAKSEIGRRILALTPTGGTVSRSTGPLAVAVAAVIVLPVAAWTLYWVLGSPNMPDQPYASRTAPGRAPAAQGDPHVDMAAAVEKLRTHLQQRPEDLDGWMLLGRSQLELSRFADAAESYRHATELSDKRPDIVGDWGEAQVLAAGGTVTPTAKAAFETALKDPESAARSRYYLALAQMQAGNPKEALQAWVDLEAVSPADAEWLPLLRRRIGEAAQAAGVDPATVKTSAGAPRKPATAAPAPPVTAAAQPGGMPSPDKTATGTPATEPTGGMPSGADVAATAKATANASPEERRAMIEAMVARLAARLEQEPDDFDGWARLGRSYVVLNQPDKAVPAFARAAKLKPGDIGVKEQYAEAIIAGGGNGDQPPPLAAVLLREVLEAEPQNSQALWYVGLSEAASGRPEAARDLWTRLLAQLPADAPERKEVEQRLAGLKAAPK
jgi:cytochrome c-type biogenesis protein CcmH